MYSGDERPPDRGTDSLRWLPADGGRWTSPPARGLGARSLCDAISETASAVEQRLAQVRQVISVTEIEPVAAYPRLND